MIAGSCTVAEQFAEGRTVVGPVAGVQMQQVFEGNTAAGQVVEGCTAAGQATESCTVAGQVIGVRMQ